MIRRDPRREPSESGLSSARAIRDQQTRKRETERERESEQWLMRMKTYIVGVH